MSRDHTGRFFIRMLFCHIFEVKPVQMGKAAVPAPHRDIAAADGNVVEAIHTAVPADSRSGKGPDRPGSAFCKHPGIIHILDNGHEDPGGTAMPAGNIGTVGHDLDQLVCQLPAVVTVRAVSGADEPVTHG